MVGQSSTMTCTICGAVSKNEEFCMKNDEFCMTNQELCTKNEELCIKNEEFCIENDELCIENDELCRHRCGRAGQCTLLNVAVQQYRIRHGPGALEGADSRGGTCLMLSALYVYMPAIDRPLSDCRSGRPAMLPTSPSSCTHSRMVCTPSSVRRA